MFGFLFRVLEGFGGALETNLEISAKFRLGVKVSLGEFVFRASWNVVFGFGNVNNQFCRIFNFFSILYKSNLLYKISRLNPLHQNYTQKLSTKN